MKKTTVLLFVSVILITLFARGAARCEEQSKRLVDYVNPFIGTGGIGFGVGSTYPGPQTPFGMVRPGPDTITNETAPGFNHCSGYWYEDFYISGFSHTRLEGIGVPGYGNISLMPVAGTGNPAGMVNENSYRAPLDHKSETASPGYYSITLPDRGVKVELTAGEFTAHHRYSFAPENQPLLVVNASHFFGDGKPRETEISVAAAAGEVYGWFHYQSPHGPGKGIETYFFIKSKSAVSSFGTWLDGAYENGRTAAHGKTAGAVLELAPAPDGVLEFKVAISFISVEQARANMEADHPGWDFEALRKRTEDAWEKILSRIIVEGATEEHKHIFYTALYHSFQMPTNWTEAGDVYLGFDDQIHRAEGFKYYTDFSMWDTFRSFHPLLALIAPDYTRDMIVSLVMMGKQGGYIPKWPVANGYTNCMIGTPADVVISDAYLKGITDFDVDFAYKNMFQIATGPTGPQYEGRSGILNYMKYGYHPADLEGAPVSETLEFAFNDYALGRFAQALGKDGDAKMLLERSKSYMNLWNPARGFFDGRNSDGSFIRNFTADAWQDIYTEGTAWQWLWFVPHDVPGLMELMGGHDAFYSKLDDFFTRSHKLPDTMMYDKYYWHGNEPDIHAAFMFLWAGRPDRTQEEVRWILRKKYDDSPDGLDGNDDGATLSAWYVLNSIGFFPIPATNRYFIGSPIFTKAVITAGDKKFTIVAPGASGNNMYVKNASLNGKPLDVPYFLHEDIIDGGTLFLEMAAEPASWGAEMK